MMNSISIEKSLDDPDLFINPQLSWIRFNERILEEAKDRTHPLLERVKFLAICGSNLDEFFMVKVSRLRGQLIKDIRKEIISLLKQHIMCWKEELVSDLAKEGIQIQRIGDMDEKQRLALRSYFEHYIFPALTPLVIDAAHPFPFISNLSINLAVVINDPHTGEKYARVKIPTSLFPRLIQVPCEERIADKRIKLVFFEDLVSSNLDLLFPGMEILAAYPFRVARDAEIEISLNHALDLRKAIEESIETRKIGYPIRLEVDSSMPAHLKNMLVNKLGLTSDMVYQLEGPLGLADLWQLLSIDRPDLKDVPFVPYISPQLTEEKNIFSSIAQKDYVLYHPYDSFSIIINFLRQAARDPDVLAIKITLYRIDNRSPIIDALMEAKQNRKAVTVLIELMARFDEVNNLMWAKALEHAGVHVVFGIINLKVHAKLCLVVRREGKNMVLYSHLSSGNYNTVTGKIYGDIGYLTANPKIGKEVSDLFNALTGYSRKDNYKYLLVSPENLRHEILRRIDREIECHKRSVNGYIAFKLNGLEDREIIQALYRASMAGVKIDLDVRGLCCLRPGIKGISDNISVRSIVGRFLEHARIYYFRNGGEEEVLLGSSDMRPRNLNKRVEVLFPVPDSKIRRSIVEYMLNIHLNDNVKARLLLPDGTYKRIMPAPGEQIINSQNWLIDNMGIWHDGEQ